MRIFLILLLLVPVITGAQPRIWINELHYDNAGTDSLEFVEVVSSEIFSGLRIYAYNGITGASYDSVLLDTLAFQTYDNYYFQVWYPDILQNGPSDGIALLKGDSLIEALSYEGTFTAMAGPAVGIEFTDIGVNESTYTPLGYSLQLDGKGIQREHFTWELQDPITPGAPNSNQTFTEFPVIYSAPADSISFSTTPFGYSSEGVELMIRAANINSPIRVYVSSGFQLDTSKYFTNPIQAGQYLQLSPVNDYLAPTSIYVRFTPPEPSGDSYLGMVSFEQSETSADPIDLYGTEGIIDYPRMWINEFHYDDIGFDTLEFVEIAIQHAPRYDLSKIYLLAYNGGTGKVYREYQLNEMLTFPTPDPAWSLFVRDIPQIQNGPDGMALCYRDSCRQLISYEGSFIATDGKAFGQQSSDIGVQEFADSPEGSSLQLMGSGNRQSDFTWVYVPGFHTRGLPNESQILPLQLLQNDFRRISDSVEVSWRCSAEVDLAGYAIYASKDGIQRDSIGWVDLNPFSNYSFKYDQAQQHYVHVKAVGFSGEITPLFILSVPGLASARWWLSNKGTLYSPHRSSDIKLKIITPDGKVLMELQDQIDDHSVELVHWLGGLEHGAYLLTIETPTSQRTIRFQQFPR